MAEILALKSGKRVGFGTKEYSEKHPLDSAESARLLSLFRAGRQPSRASGQPPPSGLGLAASDVEELSSLVSTKTAVTITE